MNINQEREVLYSACYGGFSLSLVALQELYKLDRNLFEETTKVDNEVITEEDFLNEKDSDYLMYHVKDQEGKVRFISEFFEFDRIEPRVLEVLKKLGLNISSGRNCKLALKTIKAGYNYEIREYDGLETVIQCLPYELIIHDLINKINNNDNNYRSILTEQILNGTLKLKNNNY